MRILRSVVMLIAAAGLAASPLRAQQLASAQSGLVRSRPAPRRLRAVALPSPGRDEPRRWPYVVGGAVVGGAAGGVWLAHRAAKTDDAMVSPVYAVGAVAAGAALGALGGLIVSVVIHPGAS